MHSSEEIAALLTQIRDELRESREKTLRRYDEVLAAQTQTEERSAEYWAAYERKFRFLSYGYLTLLTLILAGTVLVLAWRR